MPKSHLLISITAAFSAALALGDYTSTVKIDPNNAAMTWDDQMVSIGTTKNGSARVGAGVFISSQGDVTLDSITSSGINLEPGASMAYAGDGGLRKGNKTKRQGNSRDTFFVKGNTHDGAGWTGVTCTLPAYPDPGNFIGTIVGSIDGTAIDCAVQDCEVLWKSGSGTSTFLTVSNTINQDFDTYTNKFSYSVQDSGVTVYYGNEESCP